MSHGRSSANRCTLRNYSHRAYNITRVRYNLGENKTWSLGSTTNTTRSLCFSINRQGSSPFLKLHPPPRRNSNMAEHQRTTTSTFQPKAIIFDLLTALLDSWTIWDLAAQSTSSDITGQTWRKRYLELTYACGAYQRYESLVEQSAQDVGLPPAAPETLLERWGGLRTWPEVPPVLANLQNSGIKLGVVTNCSNTLGTAAVGMCEKQVQIIEGSEQFGFDAVVTAEESGYYKPHRKPYEDMLAKLRVSPEETLFVAGSASDVPGASGVGMRVVWHNRVGLASKGDVKPLKEGRTLEEALEGLVPSM